MLQDPVKGVLVPLSPEEAAALALVAVGLDPRPRYAAGAWEGLSDATLKSEAGAFHLGAVLAMLPPPSDPASVSYDRAYAAMMGGDYPGAAAMMAAVALSNGPAAPALYSLALALEELGHHEAAEGLAGFVADLPGYEDPRAAALAGYAAFQRRQAKSARIYLAKAARIARLRPEFRNVQRFAQRVLLMQQFALGD